MSESTGATDAERIAALESKVEALLADQKAEDRSDDAAARATLFGDHA